MSLKFKAASQQDCHSSSVIHLTPRGAAGEISVIWKRVSGIFHPGREGIRPRCCGLTDSADMTMEIDGANPP